MSKTAEIYGINGPVIYLKGNTGFKMSEMVYVGEENLVGEVISLKKEATTVQVFEETSGLRPGETVTASGDAISVTLGPGILNNIFDGIQRPPFRYCRTIRKIYFQRYAGRLSGYGKALGRASDCFPRYGGLWRNDYCRSSGNRVHCA